MNEINYDTKKVNTYVILCVVLCAIVSVVIHILIGKYVIVTGFVTSGAMLLIIFKIVPAIVMKYVK